MIFATLILSLLTILVATDSATFQGADAESSSLDSITPGRFRLSRFFACAHHEHR